MRYFFAILSSKQNLRGNSITFPDGTTLQTAEKGLTAVEYIYNTNHR